MTSLLDRFKALPGVLALRKWRYERFFATATDASLCRGVFRDFESAAASAPHGKQLGYDHLAAAAMYRERAHRLHPSDYPVLFWLSRNAADTRSVFDFGGHIGVSFYAYQRFLTFEPAFQWKVCDVPAVVEAGGAFARQHGASSAQLQFTTDRREGQAVDLWLANGSLQYLDAPLDRLLAELPIKPRRVIANMFPITDGESFVTLQNIGTAFCPYRIHQRRAVIEGMHALGYRLKDDWVNPEKSCHVPFSEHHHVDGYVGLAFERSN